MPTADGQLTAAELAQIYALVQTQAAIRQQLTDLAINGVLAAFRALRNWYDHLEVVVAALDALRIIQPAQRRMAEVTDAYLARVLTTMTGRPHRPIGAVDVTRLRRQLTEDLLDLLDDVDDEEVIPDGDLDVDRLFREPGEGMQPRPEGRSTSGDGPAIRVRDELRQTRPADMVQVYSRIAATYRFEVANGATLAKARDLALERARVLADTDIALASREQEYEVLRVVDDQQITGWRRVLRPELSASRTSCGLCIVAADRVYRRRDLKPIHANCNCEVLPIRGIADPGLQLNREDLDRLYTAAGSTGGGRRQRGALKYVRAVITEDGELGPILAEAPESLRTGKRRRSARQAVQQSRTGRILTPEERLPGLLRDADEARRRFEAGETRLAAAIDYLDRVIDEVREEMAAAA
ncbi:hypothetical protein KBX50_05270 [Micromonospora sp. C51]|uniref:hypothetical protein n=1 Tax=Micromonospora sp. C51 TaxID=2824879 RepID=UPI001B363F90|nr:hypothetical protein [Micromonospora sp. C51]MBQ1047869.1 hypothetical protein [Micromonospora sp. C51]